MKSIALRKILVFSGKIVISLGLIYWILRRVDVDEVWRFTLEHTRTVFWVAMLALLQWTIEFTRFLTILKTGGIRNSVSRTFRAFWMGYCFRFVLPGNQGEIGKMLFIGGKPAHRVAAYIYEKLGFVLALLLLFAGGLWLLYPRFYYVSILIVLLISIGLLFWRRMLDNSFIRPRFPATYRTSHPLYVQIILATGTLGVICLQYHLFLTEFGLSLVQTGAIVSIIMTVILFPISLAGIGVRESAAVFLLAPFAVSPEISTAVPFIIFVINVAVPAAIGAVVFLFSRDLALDRRIKDFSIGKYLNLKRLFQTHRLSQK